jgi:L-alanine-DL-glutamate epimerase-like enolase superfamily enzyme
VKITGVETFLMASPRRDYPFVKVSTDDGVHGWGEGTLERKQRTVAAAVGDLTPFVMDQDPTRVDHLWQRMYRHGFWRGGEAVLSAVSVHAAAVVPNYLILEYAESPTRDTCQAAGDAECFKARNGRIELPTRPGLGIELDEQYLRAHPMGDVQMGRGQFLADGTVANV